MKSKYIRMYMEMAETVAKQSYAIRKKVGCVIVSPQDLVCIGYNGCPSGWDNNCEYELPPVEFMDHPTLVTKPEVLHAESNALMKAAREGFSLKGSSMFVTYSPCVECAKLIMQAGIQHVFYREVYHDRAGIDFLIQCGIKVEEMTNV